jgi:hypothetical protein
LILYRFSSFSQAIHSFETNILALLAKCRKMVGAVRQPPGFWSVGGLVRETYG